MIPPSESSAASAGSASFAGPVREALLYDSLPDDEVRCRLCPHHCELGPGKLGICGVRENRDGRLFTLVYALAGAGQVDPVEKKPFFHLAPGSLSLSVGTPGCNFHCRFCQNWSLSQAPREGLAHSRGGLFPPTKVVEAARRHGCRSVAYTYSEPTIFFEYAYDTARPARKAGLLNVFVTNGFMSEEALDMIAPFLDGANVDLKSMRDETYRHMIGGRLEPVLDTLRRMKEKGIWVEVTTLLIPTVNDSEEELGDIADFLVSLGPETPWHISRFHPDYRFTEARPTTSESIARAREIGRAAGLHYVYAGNLPGDPAESTYCHSCGELLIERRGFQLGAVRLKAGACPSCGTEMAGVEVGDAPV